MFTLVNRCFKGLLIVTLHTSLYIKSYVLLFLTRTLLLKLCQIGKWKYENENRCLCIINIVGQCGVVKRQTLHQYPMIISNCNIWWQYPMVSKEHTDPKTFLLYFMVIFMHDICRGHCPWRNIFFVWKNSRCGKFVDVEKFWMWINLRCSEKMDNIIHTVFPWDLFWWNPCYFVGKSVLLQFTLFCRETCFDAIYALFMWRKFKPKFCPWRKMTYIMYGYIVWWSLMIILDGNDNDFTIPTPNQSFKQFSLPTFLGNNVWS